jgi:hypothetical protein
MVTLPEMAKFSGNWLSFAVAFGAWMLPNPRIDRKIA